jgi:hypothetical protein
MAFANITPAAGTDGVLYADATPLTSTEADLYSVAGESTDPIATEYGQAIVAVVQLSINGYVVANGSYVVMQIDMGDGVWIDINWCFWDGRQGTATFVFSNGVASANSFLQSRKSGSAPTPQASGSNQLCLGGRIRFVGRSVFTGGSSSVLGLTTSVSATIRYKLLGLR